MSSPRFAFEIKATDNSSPEIRKVLASVKELTPALNKAAVAAERWAAAMSKIGLRTSSPASVATAATKQAALQERTAARAAAAVQSQARAEASAAQTRANIVSRSMEQQQSAIAKAADAARNYEGITNRQAAASRGLSQSRIAALTTEEQRARAVLAVEQQKLAVARQAALISGRASLNSTGSLGTGTGDARAAAAAAKTYADQQQRVAQAAARVTAAEQARLQASQRLGAAVSQSAEQEQRALRQIELSQLRSQAVEARRTAMSIGDTSKRIALLDQELARTKAVLAAEQQRLATARTNAVSAAGSARTATGDATLASAERAARAAAEYAVQQRRVVSASNDVARAQQTLSAETRKASSALAQEGESAGELESRLNRARYALFQTGAALGIAAAIGTKALSSLIQLGVQFEAQFATVARTSGLGMDALNGNINNAAARLAFLRGELVDLSTQIPVTFEDLTTIAALGAQLGIASDDIAEFTTVIAKFSATTNVSAEQAATSFGRLQNILGVPTSEFNNLASSVAQLGVNSVATESDILGVAEQIGAVTRNAGLSAQYVIGLSTALASVRVPPELARGTTTRVFQIISRAVADGGEKLAAYAQVLGVTADAARQMFQDSPEEFFSTLITNLGHATEAGQNLTPILDSLGIKGAQNVPVITRLAAGYKLLGDYVGQAKSSFADGSFLDQSFAVTAQNVQASFTELLNSIKAFAAGVAQPFLAPLKAVLDGLKGIFNVLGNLPKFLTSGFVGLAAVVVTLTALRSAAALAGAGILALRAAETGLGATSFKVGEIYRTVIQSVRARAVASETAAVAINAEAVATERLGAAAAFASPKLTAMVAGARAQALASGAATSALAGQAGAAGATGVAAAGGAASKLGGGLTRLFGSFAGWAGLIGLVGGALFGLADSFNAADTAQVEYDAHQRELQNNFIQIGGGIDSLNEAISKDTAAWEASGKAANDANGVFATVGTTYQQMADGTTKAVTALTTTSGAITELSSNQTKTAASTEDFNSALNNAVGVQGTAATAVDTTTSALQNQEVALGANTLAWQKQAVLKNLSEAFNTPELQNALLGIGSKLPDVIEAGLKDGAAGVTAALGTLVTGADQQISELQAKIAAANQKNIDLFGQNAPGVDAQAEIAANKVLVAQYEAQLSVVQNNAAAYGILATQLGIAKDAISANAAQTQIANAISQALKISLDAEGDSAEELADKIQGTIDAYNTLVGAISAPVELQSGLFDAMDRLGQSLADNGNAFNTFTEAGRANLDALGAVVDAFGESQAAAIEAGEITAEQAAANTQQFFSDLMAQLGNMGVDTTQLDVLQNRLAQLTKGIFIVAVNANTAPAINAINQVIGVLQRMAGSAGGFLGKAISGIANSIPKPVALAPTTTTPGTFQLGQALAQGKATQAAKNLASANKAAGGAAKKAGKDQKDAADQASEALDKQKQYVKDLAGFYKELGTNAFAGVKAEGGTFESLQKLGQSLVENGKVFNTVTENGRKNFDALSDTFSNFGTVLSQQIESGAISADGAAQRYREFARGVYGELTQLGVPVENLTGFFKALGVSADGWTSGSASIQQYANFIGAAAEATKQLATQTKAAQEYAERLGEALGSAFDSAFNYGDAVDNVAKSINSLKQAYQDSIDKAAELRAANQKLSGDLDSAKVDKRKAEIEKAISDKYGETDRSSDYAAQARDAQGRIDDAQRQIDANTKEADTLDYARANLSGYTDAAIDNRSALSDLQRTMLDQIKAYAATGATTEEVTALTYQLQQQFVQAANAAGYTAAQVQYYTGAFNTYIAVIRSVPDSVTTTAIANTSQAISALNAIPRTGSHTTYAVAEPSYIAWVKAQLDAIPKSADYVVNAKVDTGSLGNLGSLGSGIGNAIGGALTNSVTNSLRNALNVIVDSFNRTFAGFGVSLPRLFEGGLIANAVRRGYARGGLIAGKPPSNPKVDNMLGTVKGELIGLRSREFVVNQPAVEQPGVLPMLERLNRGDFRGLNLGGQASGVSTAPSVGYMELSPRDRMLLQQAINRPVALYADTAVLAKSTDTGNTRLAKRGSG